MTAKPPAITVYLESIARFVHRRSGISFAGRRMVLLKDRVEERIHKLGLSDFDLYHEYLVGTPGEESILLDILTTKETCFFRNPVQFRYLAEKIIPEIESEKGKEILKTWGTCVLNSAACPLSLRILCAGCATGEEPYSVAMTLLESLRYPKAWDMGILAGDISTSCLETARAARYGEERIRKIPPSWLDKYMVTTGNGAVFTDEVKKLVTFCRMNLTEFMNGTQISRVYGKDSGFDIIFCRNVMIYFAPEAQQQLVDALFRALRPGGWLFTGDAETLHPYDHPFQLVKDADCLIYRKQTASRER